MKFTTGTKVLMPLDMSEKEESESYKEFLISTPSSSSSPFHQVPVHDSCSQQRNGTHSSDDTCIHSNGNSPFLKICIQPQEQFRFRYKSERDGGTHGYLPGECLAPNSTKTFPTVELRNYSGEAIIKCRLYQHNKNEEHPHTLHEENKGDREPKVIVSKKKGYTVCFRGLGIIHTAKREVAGHLYDKLRQRMSEDDFIKLDRAKLREKCKNIDLNRVRLRFSAHDVTTDKELCAVFSRTINNMKSAETNELKICRMSRATGSSSGGQGVMLFVEKVNKGNIRVNFFENNSKQDRGWEQQAIIHEVHRQYGIFIDTPRYKEITSDVTVWMELQRLTDGSRSEPRPFTYTPEPRDLVRKRARRHEDPTQTIVNASIVLPTEIVFKDLENLSSENQTSNESFEVADRHMECEKAMEQDNLLDELLSLDIESYNESSNSNPSILPADEPLELAAMPLEQITNAFYEDEGLEYKNFLMNHRDPLLSQFDHALYPLSAEGQGRCVWATGLERDGPQPAGDHTPEQFECQENDIGPDEYSQIYKLIKEINDLRKTKLREWYEEVTEKLDRLMEIKLPNGGTVLHMLMEEDEACFRRLVTLARSLRLRRLLAARDELGLTLLHYAVLLQRTDLINFLTHNGCDPLCTDLERNNVIHHAVKSGVATLAALLDAMARANAHDRHMMECQLAQCNDEGQTPLHVAVLEGCAASTQLLLSAGGARQRADGAGRAPIHTAVGTDRPDLVKLLLENIPEQFREDDVDSALQYACAGDQPNAAEIAALLLLHGADPLRASACRPAAWRVARRAGGALWAALAPRAPRPHPPDSDSDDYLSADDGEETSEDDITTKLGDVKIDNN